MPYHHLSIHLFNICLLRAAIAWTEHKTVKKREVGRGPAIRKGSKM